MEHICDENAVTVGTFIKNIKNAIHFQGSTADLCALIVQLNTPKAPDFTTPKRSVATVFDSVAPSNSAKKLSYGGLSLLFGPDDVHADCAPPVQIATVAQLEIYSSSFR